MLGKESLSGDDGPDSADTDKVRLTFMVPLYRGTINSGGADTPRGAQAPNIECSTNWMHEASLYYV